MVRDFFLSSLWFAAGFFAAFPKTDYEVKMRAQGAVAVYEKQATCEKALDQWVCSVPKNKSGTEKEVYTISGVNNHE